MLQALINATIIWLGSLLVYELLLKQTTFHRLNRWYMLLTFLAGILLPLLPWETPVEINTLQAAGADTVLDAAQASPGAATASTSTPGAPAAATWILIMYLTGAAVMLLVLVRDQWRISGLYRHASKHREGRWTIAQSSAVQSPFSFMNVIFVGDRGAYTDQQWRMLVSHEQEHFRSGHLFDLLLMHAAMVPLWFHPLVYVYRSRLRLIHEYEVDSLQSSDTLSYGRFLLEQAACRPMAMTHALNFSPLKNRIQMMTKNASTRRARARFLMLIPLMACSIWCCAKNQEKVAIDIKDRYAMRQDANVTYSKPRGADTIIMTDRVTGKEQTVIMNIDTRPEKLNGVPIMNRNDLKIAPQCKAPGSGFGIRYLIENSRVASTLQKMPDGEYFMAVSDLIIDQNGRVAYFMITLPENHREMTPGPGGMNIAKPNGLTAADKADVQKRIAQALIGGDVLFTTAGSATGEAAPYFLSSDERENGFRLSTTIRVKDHRISFGD